MTGKEKHPYLDKYPLLKAYKYLVIGTMPPARQLPPGTTCIERKKKQRTFVVDYYYGNAASFWKIMKELYPGNHFDNVYNIQRWQDEYCIGITDTVSQCKRKDPCSYKDSDLILEWSGYNHSLKVYVLAHKEKIEKLIFTSGENCNNALANFKIIMGDKFNLIADKVVDDLPSPSGGSNTSNFNSNNDTLGLKKSLYDYMILMANEADIEFVRKQWNAKQAAEAGVKINRIPKNMLKKYKVWKYKSVFPLVKCKT